MLYIDVATPAPLFGIDYTTTCGIPKCLDYFDGCNDCSCTVDGQIGDVACTES